MITLDGSLVNQFPLIYNYDMDDSTICIHLRPAVTSSQSHLRIIFMTGYSLPVYFLPYISYAKYGVCHCTVGVYYTKPQLQSHVELKNRLYQRRLDMSHFYHVIVLPSCTFGIWKQQ